MKLGRRQSPNILSEIIIPGENGCCGGKIPISHFLLSLTHSALIYFRGFKSEDLVATLDFLYFGEANVYQENLDSFLAIAEELNLKGLTGQTSGDVLEEPKNPKPVHKIKEPFMKPTTYRNDLSNSEIQNANGEENASRALAIPTQFIASDIQALDEKVKSLMERSQNMITSGKQRTTAYICKVCGKEGYPTSIRNHIEANHLNGISLPCALCEKTFNSRFSLRYHKKSYHN